MMLPVFLMFLFGHALADFPLQGDYLSKAKSRRAPLPGTPWWIAMTAHATIHAGFVFLITVVAMMLLGDLRGHLDSVMVVWAIQIGTVLAACEFVIHSGADDAKCEGLIGYKTDQAIHILCKAGWTLVVFLC